MQQILWKRWIGQDLLKSIHYSETRQKFFNRPIYCRATRQLTPVKQSEAKLVKVTESSDSDTSDNYETGYDEDMGGQNKTKLPKNCKSKFFKKRKDLPSDDESGSDQGFVWDDLSVDQPADNFIKPTSTPGISGARKERNRTSPTGPDNQKKLR